MKSKLGILALALAILGSAQTYALTGSWRGNLSFGGVNLPLVFNFSESTSGVTQCTMDSPNQGATGIPVSVALCTADSVALDCKVIGASYNGKIAGGTITGTFRQRGMSFPLTLKGENPLEVRRPQTPRAPFPYESTDTTFTAPDGTVLAGTLTMPMTAESRKIPAVVFISGSGPQNRDEELFEHRPFAVIADYLARNGIASLRYDDRGTAKSGGDFRTATTYTFKDDARAAVNFLCTVPAIGKVGVIGHSEGGTIAFLLGADKVPDFIVSLAGMAIPGKETILDQNRRSLAKSGMSESDIRGSLTLLSLLFDEMAHQARRDGQPTPVDIDSLVRKSKILPPATVLASMKASQKTRTPWLDVFLGLDPTPDLAKIECPVLAINGDKDTQVDATANLAAIKKHCKKAEPRLMPSLNHLMQHAQTGEVAEYSEIRETISPDVLALILSFIKDQTLN